MKKVLSLEFDEVFFFLSLRYRGGYRQSVQFNGGKEKKRTGKKFCSGMVG